MAISKNFVVKNGIEVAENLIYTEGQSVGIGTTLPDYLLSVNGDIAISGGFYVPNDNPTIKIATGIVSSTSTDTISGIDTASLLTGDYVTGTYIQDNTRITAIGSSSLTILPNHINSSGVATTAFTFLRYKITGEEGDFFVSQGPNLPPKWADVADISVGTAENVVGGYATVTTVDATTYLGGDASALSGIVTQITAGIGVRLSVTETPGKGIVNIDSYYPIGKTIFVTQNGNDANSGLTENDSKKTIKAAAAIAFPGDTIKVYPGVYVENNPIQLSNRVSVEGTELRNCVVTPRFSDRDLFHVNNSCNVTDLSFISDNNMTNGASIIALQPLLGVSTDRFFDAARMIRYNLDFIAAETVGYLTSTDYKNPAFVVVDGAVNPTAPVNCSDDIKDVMKAVIHDITRGGNSKCVGAGRSYYDDAGALLHITGTDPNGYSVKTATIDALNYAAGIARSCINNVSWTGNYQ